MNQDNKLDFNTTLTSMEWFQKGLCNMNDKIWYYIVERKIDWFNKIVKSNWV